MRWNGIYTLLFAEEGAYIHGVHGNAQAPLARRPSGGPSTATILSPSHPTRVFLFLALFHPALPPCLPPSLPANPHGRLSSVIRTKHPIGRVRSLRARLRSSSSSFSSSSSALVVGEKGLLWIDLEASCAISRRESWNFTDLSFTSFTVTP